MSHKYLFPEITWVWVLVFCGGTDLVNNQISFVFNLFSIFRRQKLSYTLCDLWCQWLNFTLHYLTENNLAFSCLFPPKILVLKRPWNTCFSEQRWLEVYQKWLWFPQNKLLPGHPDKIFYKYNQKERKKCYYSTREFSTNVSLVLVVLKSCFNHSITDPKILFLLYTSFLNNCFKYDM